VVNADDFDFHFFPIYYRQHLECEAYKWEYLYEKFGRTE
jgi:hypothetical protein